MRDLFHQEPEPNFEESIRQMMQELARKVAYHDYRYYVLNDPEISDYEYDQLYHKLLELEKRYPHLADPNSPTQRVGGTITKTFEQAPHSTPMLSLDNTYDEGELRDWDRRVRELTGRKQVEYVCELKIDGVSISLTYRDRALWQALTRGDGYHGDVITNNVRTIRSVPLYLPSDAPDVLEVRGEIYMPVSVFNQLNRRKREELEELGYSEEQIEAQLMKNPRNATAGTLKLQKSAEVARRKLEAFLYFIIQPIHFSTTHFQNLERLKNWGFKVCDFRKVAHGIDEVIHIIKEWEHQRKSLDFETDGVVIKVNELALWDKLGTTAKSPRWAVAFKYPPEVARTRLKNVVFQVGRTGAVTPVAELAPVFLSGTTVKRATLHNEDFIRQLDLHIGDTVMVEKAGEIIPKITGVMRELRPPHARPVVFPSHCPECGSVLVRRPGEAAWYCPNESGCPPIIIGKLEHFVHKKAMDIQSLGEKTLQDLYEAGLVCSPADLYQLSEADIMKLEGYKELSARNIINGIRQSLQRPFERVLFALGIRYVGETVAKKLAHTFGSIDALAAADLESLKATEDVGDMIAESVYNWFRKPENIQLLEKLKKAGLKMETQAPIQGSSDKLKGLSFVVSGVFSVPRETLKEKIEQYGGRILSSVSRNTSYLIAGQKPGPEKLHRAAELKIPIISEEEFYRLLEKD
ncbi:MAG: NAD-dependent DNA ligase LigA [Flavobacteriales bacterium]|nr:NAD-dependent DNA ligase LigA [Flavobacteriales bacterium]MCX7767535.1 NAD-dependent DNA ligase LigA [Flavobacteriales bacterium]MDW8410392.1 NAD-dependent DNA ligase LigA [Flavobacteriales bacterium]